MTLKSKPKKYSEAQFIKELLDNKVATKKFNKHILDFVNTGQPKKVTLKLKSGKVTIGPSKRKIV